MLSTGLFKLMSAATGPDFERWGWRIPFLASIVLVGIGLYVRLRVMESPSFTALKRDNAVVQPPVVEVIKRQPREILTSAFVRLSEQAPFYLFITFVLTYGTEKLSLAARLAAQRHPDRCGCRSGQRAVLRLPLRPYRPSPAVRRRDRGHRRVRLPVLRAAEHRYGLVLLAIVLSLVFHDMQYGPQAALIAESFGTNIRYSGAGIGYQLASVIAGGPAPLIAAAILKNTGSSTGISWYIIGCCVVAFVALLLMPRRSTANATDVYDAQVEKALPTG